MASSAGLRERKQIIRFSDEFGSLGSGKTLQNLQIQVYKQIYAPKHSNGVLASLFMAPHWETCGDRAASKWNCYYEAEGMTYDEKLELFRGNAYHAIEYDDRVCMNTYRLIMGNTRAEKDILTFYCPYYEIATSEKEDTVKHLMEVCGLKHKFCVEYDYKYAQNTIEDLPIHERRLVEVIERIAKKVYEQYIPVFYPNSSISSVFNATKKEIKMRLTTSSILVRNLCPIILKKFLPKALAMRKVLMMM